MRLSKLLSRLTLIALLPIMNTLSSSAFGQTTDPNLSEAQRLFKQGQYTLALAKADTYVGSKPKDPQGRFVRGLILTEMKRTSDAILVFKKLTEDFPELPEPYNNLAVLYAQEKQYDKARASLEAAIKTHPAYAVAHENLGDIYAKLASQAYGKALQIDASNSTAQTKMAMIRDLVPPVTAAAVTKPGQKPTEPIRLASNDPTRISAPVLPNHPATRPGPAAATPTAPVVMTPPAPPVAAPQPPAVTPPPVTKPTPVAVVTPPPAPTPPPVPPTRPVVADQDPGKTIHAWANAWSNKDVKGYLAAYAPDFQTPSGMARKAWESEREARLTKPGKIEVSIEKPSVEMNGSDKATVKFRQNYRSANMKSSAVKTVVLVKVNGRWLIQQERVN